MALLSTRVTSQRPRRTPPMAGARTSNRTEVRVQLAPPRSRLRTNAHLMKLFDILRVAALSLLVGACATTSPSDKASKQAEIRQAAQQSLDKFYKADPKLQSAVANAPGYAVFTTYGLSFVVGGSGGA